MRLAALCSVLACLIAGAWSESSRAAPPAGFQETTAFSGLNLPTAVSFSPDGRVFVAEKSGVIKVFEGLGSTTATQFADLRTEVHNFWDRGLLGMVLDPDFPSEPYVYVSYTRDALPGGEAPRWGSPGVSSDPCPNPPGPTADGCVVTGRVARLTASGSTASAVTPLITDWCQQYPSHSIGDVAFAADGALYVSGGDGASFNFVDWGQGGGTRPNMTSPVTPANPCGDPPSPIGTPLSPPDAEGGALRSQDALTTGDPTSLDGTVIRVDPATGAGLPGNPFFASGDANLRRIIAIGQRNPFKMADRPGTNEMWTGETGWGTWEEINRIADPGGELENFGWPCYEGSSSGPVRQGGYDAADLDICEDLYVSGDVDAPLFSYNHSSKVITGESCPSGGSSVGGVEFYEHGDFPNSYNGALFFADYTRDCMWVLKPNASGVPDKNRLEAFNPGAANPVDIEFHEGELFYVDYDGGRVRRIVHTQGNAPPDAVATATPSSGPAPLSVTLSATGSTDPDDAFETLSFAWDLDGDGFDDGTGPTLNAVFPAGTHTASVRVTDPDGASDIDSVQIQADNSPPVAQINTPTTATTWAVDDVIGFSGSATDAQETLPASAFDWDVIIDHCPSNCHEHLAEQYSDTTSGSFSAPDHEYPSTLTIRLTVTDSGGLSDTESVTIAPKTVELTLDSAPAGLELALNAEARSAPFTRTVIQGSQNTVSAPSPQSLSGQSYEFGSWSDGGAASHTVVADSGMTLIASFNDVTPPEPPQITDSDPDSPSNDENPRLKGSAEIGSTVRIYAAPATSDCVLANLTATGGQAQFAGAGLQVTAASDTTIVFRATATDAAGNVSACSAAFNYVEDSTAPETTIDSGPSGPTASNDPTFTFSGSDPGGSGVASFECRLDSGDWDACTSPRSHADLPDGPHTFEVRALDAAGNVDQTPATRAFTIDTLAPDAPTIEVSVPASPANENNPELQGSAEAGSTVRIYASDDCGGPVAVQGSATAFDDPGLSVSVPDDSTTDFTATATDAAGNVSACSVPFAYTEISTPPEAPRFLATVPSSPANDNSPRVRGRAPAASDVEVFVSEDCNGPAAASGGAGQFGEEGLAVVVPDNVTVSLSARALEGVHQSPCSESVSYREDSLPPRTRIDDDVPRRVRARSAGRRSPKMRLEFLANEPVSRYECRLDSRAWKPCWQRVLLRKLKRGRHRFRVRATDLAGNTELVPSRHKFKVVKRRKGKRGL